MLRRLVIVVWGFVGLACLVTLATADFMVYKLLWPLPRSTASQTGVAEVKRAVLEQVRNVNKQILVEHYDAVEVQYQDAPVDWLSWLVKQDLLVVIRGTVPAGFDLQKLSDESVWVSRDGARLQLTLPAPEVFEENVAIDSANSQLVHKRDTCPWFICTDPLVEYQSKVLPEATSYLVNFALQNGILEQAARNGQDYYKKFLEAFVGTLGVKEVRVVVTGYGP